jgi:RNA polymerase sigma-70 factor (ECF subfamily)
MQTKRAEVFGVADWHCEQLADAARRAMRGIEVLDVATVRAVEPVTQLIAPPASFDTESGDWLRALRAEGKARDEALGRLHALLLRAARFEVGRRRQGLPHLRTDELDEIAAEAADDALLSVLRRLDDFRGASRFTTWVYKFALLEAAVKVRKRSWQGREIPLEAEAWDFFAAADLQPDAEAEQSELLETVQTAIADVLTPHQRTVLVALALNEVPIDVLAERLNTNRGALYKTLHDARRKLRKHLLECGLALDNWLEEK